MIRRLLRRPLVLLLLLALSFPAGRAASALTFSFLQSRPPAGAPAGTTPKAPEKTPAPGPKEAEEPVGQWREPEPAVYTIQAGDSLFLIARRHATTVAALKAANGLASDVIYAGNSLVLPGNRPDQLPSRSPAPQPRPEPQPVPEPQPAPEPGSTALVPARFVFPAGFKVHHVSSGETLSRIASSYGTTVEAILETNGLVSDLMQVGQPLFLRPGGTSAGAVSVTTGPSGPGGSELLDWEHARWLFTSRRQAVIRDLESGLEFRVVRLGGGNHADCEPLTAEDTRTMKAIAGGAWTWTPKPVQVIVSGRKIAASINFMPHSVQTVTDNGFAGHFCVHFRHSRTHNTNQEDARHQANVLKAAGLEGIALPPGL